MSGSANERWQGCHGVAVAGDAVEVGSAFGEPMATAAVRFGPVAEADGTLLWVQHGEVEVDGALRVVDRVLVRRPDGRLLLSGHGPKVEVDPRAATVTIDSADEAVHRQLVAAFALPLLLHDVGALMIHGSACSSGDETILVCGDSGAGKSSTLVSLVDAGWLAVSEDLCALDLDASGGPVVWPGPPWVRLAKGQRGPRGCAALFEQVDKTAWGISHVQTSAAKPLRRIIVLEPPGGDAAVLERIATAEAIRVLARHSVWLLDQDDRGRRLFEPVATLAARVPTFRMRLPRSDRWAEAIPELLASSTLLS